MVETPRAALTADEIAKDAEFFSFGTNDLTQMTFGLSRDDTGKLIETCMQKDILEADPFRTLDTVGVGKLLELSLIHIFNMLKEVKTPKLLIINKIDRMSPEDFQLIYEEYQDLGMFDDIFGVSALEGKNVDKLLLRLRDFLAEGPM